MGDEWKANGASFRLRLSIQEDTTDSRGHIPVATAVPALVCLWEQLKLKTFQPVTVIAIQSEAESYWDPGSMDPQHMPTYSGGRKSFQVGPRGHSGDGNI